MSNIFITTLELIDVRLEKTWIPIKYPAGYNNVIIQSYYNEDSTLQTAFSFNKDRTYYSFKRITYTSSTGTIGVIFTFYK